MSSFFPQLKRRKRYSVKTNGKFYSYRHFRENHHNEIAEDCLCRCVYCDIHEGEIGGREQMEIDHFRPYTRPGFEHLEDDPNNFHHACGRCNLLKSDKWPSTHPTESHDGVSGFLDPFLHNRSQHFEVENNGGLKALQPPAECIIRVLALNRPHLKLLRERRIYQIRLKSFFQKNLPEWEKAARGEGAMAKEDLAKDLLECKRLCELCSIV